MRVIKEPKLLRGDVWRATNRAQQVFTYGSLPGCEDFYFEAGNRSRVPDAVQRVTMLRSAGIKLATWTPEQQRVTSCCAASGEHLGLPSQTTTLSRFAARVIPVYSHRARLSWNAKLSSNSTTSSHCEPCDLCTVST